MNPDHRKGRGTSNRLQRGGRNQPGSSSSASTNDNIYRNDRFTDILCALTGKRVHLEVKNGKFYDGVLTTISPKCEFVLSKVHMLEDDHGKVDLNKVPNPRQLIERVVFSHKDIVTITCPSVDIEECKKGDTFQTDTSISQRFINGEINERELQPWQPDENSQDAPVLGVKSEKSNGWRVDEMFKVNELKYGVTSSFDSSMASYTTTLEKKNTEEYMEREKHAAKLAKEIEQDQHFNDHIDSGKTEEDLYSAVVRQSTGNRYVPPHVRGRQPAPVIERKDKGVNNNDSRKTPSPHVNSPVSARKTNGEDAKQAVDSDQLSKGEAKAQVSKGDSKGSQDVRSEMNTEQIKEKLMKAKPIHVEMVETAEKVQKLKNVKKKDLVQFHSDFNLATSEPTSKVKNPMPETQDIRKLEEREKLQNKEANPSVPAPASAVQIAISTTPPLSHEYKAPSPTSNKPSSIESGETSPSPTPKSILNPNAMEFKLNPMAKSFIPKPPSPSQSQGVPTPVQMPTAMPQPSPNMMQHMQYPMPHRPRPRMAYVPRSDYGEYSSTSPIMTAAVATGAPIIAAPQPIVYQPYVQTPQGMTSMPLPQQMGFLYPGQQRFMQPYNMAISATPSGMVSSQGTMVTAGNYHPGVGNYPEGPLPVFVSQSGTMAAPQHLLPGQPQSYQQHMMTATTPTGPPPHQSPQAHQQQIFFQVQQQPGGPQPPQNQPQHILQAGHSPVGMGQPPPMMMMSQTAPQQQPSAYR